MKTKQHKGIMAGGLAVCMGLLIGCTSSKYEETDYVMSEPAGASMEQNTASGQNEWVIPLHEEQMKVGTRNVGSQVTIHKIVTTETVNQPVDLRKERLIIEREPAGAEANKAVFGNPFEEKSITIGLQQEEPVVEKTTVRTGQVVARKNTEWSKQTVKGEVRHEDIQVDKSGTSAGSVSP